MTKPDGTDSGLGTDAPKEPSGGQSGLDLEPVAHPVLWLRHHPAALRQGRVRRVKEWLQRVFDAGERPWFREEFIHPREFSRPEVAKVLIEAMRQPVA